MESIEKVIQQTNDANQGKVNWTKAWGQKYPILKRYQSEVDIEKYQMELRKMLENMKAQYGYSELDALLVLKDILYHEWKDKK